MTEGVRETGDPAYPLVLRGWAELSAKDVEALKEYFRAEPVYESIYEFGWAGDAQATTFYATREEAEEFMGNPRQFRRVKAGDWEEVDPDLITKDDVGPVTYTSQEAKPVGGDPSFGQRITTHKAEPQHGQNGYATGNGYGHG